MSSAPRPPGGAAGEATPPLPERFRRHAESLEQAGRSPLCVTVLRAAGEDIRRGGLVGELLDGIPFPPGSVPTLRLLGALHHLVLSGRSPDLAAFYPSAGGGRPPEGIWPVALETLAAHAGWMRARLRRPVQTNEPGRAAVLFPALLWLVRRHALPIRLLEIGASAGLNLMADRFCYLVAGRAFGAPGSTVRFPEPWRPGPDIDMGAAARALEIVAREGCDLAPLDPRDPADRLTALSYIWPDELERFERARAALELAAADPPPVAAEAAEEWLPRALAAGRDGQLTVIWQSIVRQYIDAARWAAIEAAVRAAAGADPRRPVAWLRMERAARYVGGSRLTVIESAGQAERLLAGCDDHGPPVVWER